MTRGSGILLPVFSLPGAYGIGTMGGEAFRFVDFLKASGTGVWQVLPLGETGYGDSPFQSVSTFAGNPYLIDLAALVRQGLLDAGDIAPFSGGDDAVDYDYLRQTRDGALRAAFRRSYPAFKGSVDRFAKQTPWLADYALFRALKDSFGGRPWAGWEDAAIRRREKKAMARYAGELKEDVAFHMFVQYLFFSQWLSLKSYANQNGVRIFGDMPIYVAMDSADTWANPALFDMDQDGRPRCVAGVPPDYFTQDGQLWGNPLYDWRAHKRTRYRWWLRRMTAMARCFDMLRIDHFIGFASYYAVSADATTAREGCWHDGPGRALFRAVKRALPRFDIVAEDLGAVTPKVKQLLDWCGYPGMKVLQFAFGSDEANPHLPAHIGENSVVYTGTHDNDTTIGWWAQAGEAEKSRAAGLLETDADICGALIAAAFASAARTAVIPMQDHLRLGSEARMNTPGTIGANWRWRMRPGALTDSLRDGIFTLNMKFDRTGEPSS